VKRIAVTVLLAGLFLGLGLGCERTGKKTPSNAKTEDGGGMEMEKATFAAGCFWGVEAAFGKVQGVASTSVGYTGGTFKKPSYEEVCTGTTAHAEAVEVTYDPSRVNYEELLDVFWGRHDPTTLNRQGPDAGTQYRSAVFFRTPEEEAAALASMARLQKEGKHKRPIVTEIVPAAEFYRAEEYHQQYLEKRGMRGCR